jgi:hypothetical protein
MTGGAWRIGRRPDAEGGTASGARASGATEAGQTQRRLGLAVPQVTAGLLMLEMKKAARRLPGNCYERC